MALLTQRLNGRIEAGAKRRVAHPSRIKVYTATGQLSQAFPSGRIKHFYDVSHGVRTQADYQQVLAAFYVVMGTPYSGLLFRDIADYQATQANSRLTLVSGSDYQLQRVYSFGGIDYLRNITRPVNDGTLTVYRTRSGVVTVASATIDYTTGVATISGHAGGDTYTWVGNFDVPVTFTNNDWVAALAVSTNNLHLVNEEIELEEVFE